MQLILILKDCNQDLVVEIVCCNLSFLSCVKSWSVEWSDRLSDRLRYLSNILHKRAAGGYMRQEIPRLNRF